MLMRVDGKRLRSWLRGGGLIAYATESCFGLGCHPRNWRALGRLLHLKRRPAHKGLIVIGDHPQRFGTLLQRGALQAVPQWIAQWPAPLTLLLPAGAACLPRLRGRHAKLAVRVPDHTVARELCRLAGSALVSTSANRAGRPSIRTARECRRQFGSRVWVVDGRIGKRRQPSTIIDPEQGWRLR